MATDDEVVPIQSDAVAVEAASKPCWYDDSEIKKLRLRLRMPAPTEKKYVPVEKDVDWRSTQWRNAQPYEYEGDENFLIMRQEALSRDDLNADQKLQIAAAKTLAELESILAEKL
jgi:hypothetical protein